MKLQIATGNSRMEKRWNNVEPPLLFLIKITLIAISPKRQPLRPLWLYRHNLTHLIHGASALRHFRYDLIMAVHHDGVSFLLHTEHCLGEKECGRLP